MRRILAITLLLLPAAAARAEQYRSEVRELPQTPPEIGPQDPAELLKKTRDPYPRALLLRELAARAAAAGRTDQAADYLEQALATGALSGIAAQAMRDQLVALRSAGGDPDAIIASLEPMRRRGEPLTAAQQAALGAAYARKRRHGEALPLLRAAVSKAGDSADASWLRALMAVHAALGQDAQAAALAQRILRLTPQERDSWLQAAAWRLKAGQNAEAQALMEVAARLGMLDDAASRLRLIRLTAHIGAPFQAASQLQRWIADDLLADTTDNRRLLAQLWLQARESALAAEAIERVLARGSDAGLLRQLGQIRMDQERYAEAEQAFTRALAAGADDAATHMALAMVRYQQADVEGALQALRDSRGGSAAQRRLVADWIEYLQSGQAREQAMRAAVARQRRQQDSGSPQIRLAGGIDTVELGGERPASAAAAPGEAALTPVGALAAGNADGTIPPWRGSAGVADELRFTIDRNNADRYAARLSDGHRALLEARAGFSMPVYASQRPVVYPPAIESATQSNRDRAQLVGTETLRGARLGFPFPQPQSGVEVMWNHRLRWRGNSFERRSTQFVIGADGSPSSRMKQHERVLFRYGNLESPADLSKENVLLYYLTWFTEGRGFLALVHETADGRRGARSVWVQPPGLPRLFRIPPVGYDQPFPGSQGLYFLDMIDMYNGAFDRYVWKLSGKRELYLPYNNQTLAGDHADSQPLLRAGFLAPQQLRYELHRVWVVEATERQGARHRFGKRVFYVDEDSWNIVLVENYDRQGRLWRVQEGHLWFRPDVQVADAAPVVTYDLKDGRCFVNRLRLGDPPAEYNLPDIEASQFTPAAVGARHVR